jgi:hypothetical protein
MVRGSRCWPVGWGTEAQGTHLREGEAGHNVLLEGEMGDTSRSQTISTKLREIAEQAETWLAGQQSYAPELYRDFGYRGTG